MTLVDLHHVIDGAGGDRPPLVLGSSLGTTLAMWDPQIAALAEHARVVRYDHRGHGGSPPSAGPWEIADLGRDVLRLLDRLGLERVALGGVSLGGMLAMWVATHAPARVERLVLCCTSAHMPNAAWTARAAAVRSAGTTEPVADEIVGRWVTPGFAAAHPDVRAWLRAMLVSVDASTYAACCEALARMDLRPGLGGIRAPTLVIGGQDDPATPPEHQRAIARAVPGARLELLAGASHLAGVERPDAVTGLVLDHLGKEP